MTEKPNGHKHVIVSCGSCGFKFTARIIPEKDRKGYFVAHVKCAGCGIDLVLKDIEAS